MKYFLRKTISMFPLIYDTERPDDASACLFEGKVFTNRWFSFYLVAPNFLLIVWCQWMISIIHPMQQPLERSD